MANRLASTCIATALLVAAGAFPSAAVAQDAALCERYRAELASLQQGPDPRAQQYAVAAQRQRAELDRTRAYAQQIGCERGLFGGPPPPECAGLQARIRQMRNNLDQLLAAADSLSGGPGLEARRRQLMAAIDQACRPGGRPRSLFEALFGGGPSQEPAPPGLDGQPPPDDGQQRPLGGSKAVCVRTADGYFFPLGASPPGRPGQQEMCQALCPGSPVELFFMSQGGSIEQAVSATGKPYADLPSASKYEKSLDPNVSCRPPGQTWAQALQGAEQLLDHRASDILVTEQKAEELSRPKVAAASPKGKDKAAEKAAAKSADDADDDTADDANAVPTASSESAGIGPQTIQGGPTVQRSEGPTQEVTGPDGKKRKVRIVAPNVVAVPQAQTKVRTQ